MTTSTNTSPQGYWTPAQPNNFGVLARVREAGVSLQASEAQAMLLGMYPEAVYQILRIDEHRDIRDLVTRYRIHTQVFVPGKLQSSHDDSTPREMLQEEVREVTVHDNPSSPTHTITYNQSC